MPDSIPLSIRAQFPSAFPARWGFAKGLVVGAVVEVPAIAGLLWLLAQGGMGDSAVPFARLLRFTALFAGTAGILTAGGVGRLAAHASTAGGRRRAMVVAARAHAVAALGLVLIAALPHRHLPATVIGWLTVCAGGAVVGAGIGAVIGFVCSGPAPVGIADVVALARTPGHALQQLVDPADLRQLGATLRDRTEDLLTGMFEPAAPPPAEPPTNAPEPSSPQADQPPKSGDRT